jgi:hypothetical protein
MPMMAMTTRSSISVKPGFRSQACAGFLEKFTFISSIPMSASIVLPVSTKDNFVIEKGERKFAPKNTPFRRRQLELVPNDSSPTLSSIFVQNTLSKFLLKMAYSDKVFRQSLCDNAFGTESSQSDVRVEATIPFDNPGAKLRVFDY